MRIAAVHDSPSVSAEQALAELATTLVDRGLRVVGAVQHTRPATTVTSKEMRLRLIPSGETATISAELPAATGGCVLDHDAFENAAHKVSESIERGYDVAILSKFGLRETEGHGLRDAIVRAVENDLPLFIGVGPARMSAFAEFLGEAPDRLAADEASMLDWLANNKT